MGSSPLARGALDGANLQTALTGLIPAGAGSTRDKVATERHRAAHPRWRGEHSFGTIAAAGESGSSPLARGAPD